MKVKELMEILKTLNPDSEVLIDTWWETVIQDEGTVATKILEFNDNYFYIDEDDGHFIIDARLDDEQEENKIDYYKRGWFDNKDKMK